MGLIASLSIGLVFLYLLNKFCLHNHDNRVGVLRMSESTGGSTVCDTAKRRMYIIPPLIEAYRTGSLNRLT